MSLRRQPLGPVPELTAKAARGAFRKGNVYMAFADAFGASWDWDDFEEFFPAKGQPGEHPFRLALALLLQYAEGLSDRQAAEAIRSRIDWKYVLRLEIDDPGLDHTVLCEFRNRMGNRLQALFDKLLRLAEESGLLDTSKQRTDSTHVLAAVRKLGRLELVHETMCAALDELADVAPDWIQEIAPGDWYERYGGSFNYKLKKTDDAREKRAQQIGKDGFLLLQEVNSAKDSGVLNELESVKILRQVWNEQYVNGRGGPRFRGPKDERPEASEMIASPHDTDARLSKKRSEEWVGYKAHITETCSEGKPRLITNVITSHGCENDSNVLPSIHKSLRQRGLSPIEHLVDYGYTDANEMWKAKKNGIQVIGPVKVGPSWQTKAEGRFDQSQFKLDWEHRQAVCPNGVASKKWKELPETNSVMISFPPAECAVCPLQLNCTDSMTSGRRLEVKQQHLFEYLRDFRKYQQSDEFRERYKLRSGIEGTHSQAVRRCGLRRARYVGKEKTHTQHLLTAIALNVVRIGSWLLGVPLTRTRIRSFASLAA